MRKYCIAVVVFVMLATGVEAQDALDEVNAARASRGLPAFQRDDGLTKAALSVATFRASRGMSGHADDFAHLPPGTSADAAGCAAWPVGMGWGACCTYENWTHAGAACVTVGGVRYMHLFVRGGGSSVVVRQHDSGRVQRTRIVFRRR